MTFAATADAQEFGGGQRKQHEVFLFQQQGVGSGSPKIRLVYEPRSASRSRSPLNEPSSATSGRFDSTRNAGKVGLVLLDPPRPERMHQEEPLCLHKHSKAIKRATDVAKSIRLTKELSRAMADAITFDKVWSDAFEQTQELSRAMADATTFDKGWSDAFELAQKASQTVAGVITPPELSEVSVFPSFTSQIIGALEAEPIEDGYTHPAESILHKAIEVHGTDAGRRLHTLVFFESKPSLGASILRLLGRIRPLTDKWRVETLKKALAYSDIEMRDAAIQAAELWEGDGVVEVLRGHLEPIPWLLDYMEGVISDLTE